MQESVCTEDKEKFYALSKKIGEDLHKNPSGKPRIIFISDKDEKNVKESLGKYRNEIPIIKVSEFTLIEACEIIKNGFKILNFNFHVEWIEFIAYYFKNKPENLHKICALFYDSIKGSNFNINEQREKILSILTDPKNIDSPESIEHLRHLFESNDYIDKLSIDILRYISENKDAGVSSLSIKERFNKKSEKIDIIIDEIIKSMIDADIIKQDRNKNIKPYAESINYIFDALSSVFNGVPDPIFSSIPKPFIEPLRNRSRDLGEMFRRIFRIP